MLHGHESGVVHGALRPDWIFFDAGHRPKVCGFGTLDLRRLAREALAPKASKSEARAALSDVFSFSLMSYIVVTGITNVTIDEVTLGLQAREKSQEQNLALRVAGGAVGIVWLSSDARKPASMADFLASKSEKQPSGSEALADKCFGFREGPRVNEVAPSSAAPRW
jgi:hypothetical protein